MTMTKIKHHCQLLGSRQVTMKGQSLKKSAQKMDSTLRRRHNSRAAFVTQACLRQRKLQSTT